MWREGRLSSTQHSPGPGGVSGTQGSISEGPQSHSIDHIWLARGHAHGAPLNSDERWERGTCVLAPAASPWRSSATFSLCSWIMLKAELTKYEMGPAWGCQVSQQMKKCCVYCRLAPRCLGDVRSPAWTPALLQAGQGTKLSQLILVLPHAT